MLYKIIYLLNYVGLQNNIIIFLLSFIGVNTKIKPELPDDIRYRHFIVDSPPIIQKPQTKDYKSIICPVCGAPHEYIYDNNGNKGSYKCKVCSKTFGSGSYSITATFKCPHCGKALDKIKNRKDYSIHKCRNKNCSYFLNNLKNLNEHDKEMYELQPSSLKLHYIYRAFDLKFKQLKTNSNTDYQNIKPPKVDLSRIHASKYVLGLILTYRVNYGLTARKVAKLMYDVHMVKISHQTVLNYLGARRPYNEAVY